MDNPPSEPPGFDILVEYHLVSGPEYPEDRIGDYPVRGRRPLVLQQSLLQFRGEVCEYDSEYRLFYRLVVVLELASAYATCILSRFEIVIDIEPLYFMGVEKYNDLLQRVQTLLSIGTKFDSAALDILELLAQKESRTIAEITRVIKSTERERVYKNVRDIVQKLESSKLITEDTEMDKTKRRHNEKYFKLTDNGIYQLFLNRIHGILADQLSVKKGQIPISYVDTFLKRYGNNLVFQLFLYPYFERQTISIDNFGLVVKLFHYVHNCCKQLDAAMQAGQYAIPQFVWNKIPGQDDNALLASLKKVFSIDELNKNNTHINKNPDDDVISVADPEIHIDIKLDLPRSKAIATLDIGNKKNIREYEYAIANLFSETTACIIRPPEDLIRDALDTKRLIEAPIYELVSSVWRGTSSQSLQEKDYDKILADDAEFMLLLEGLHNNFEKGYQHLIELRKRS